MKNYQRFSSVVVNDTLNNQQSSFGGCQISKEREKIAEAPHTVNVGDSVLKITALILASEIIKAEICA